MVSSTPRKALWLLVVWPMLQHSLAFVNSGSLLGVSKYKQTTEKTILYVLNGTDSSSNIEDNNSFLESYVTVAEPRLLMGDIISILMASQMMGLLDVLNDPVFWQSGGFNQPIPAIPSTLPTLIQRDSLLSLSWLPAALSRKGFQYETIATNTTTLRTTAIIWITFVFLRVGAELGLASATHSSMDTLEVARQCWFVALFVGTFRYIYGQYNR
mmetsp:Transcript_15394/g.21448  ORF Transcript_15394/g.21448 Transcript_15394/m.21448 type:complete len:213 (+) Transcript_15394:172-810(+)